MDDYIDHDINEFMSSVYPLFFVVQELQIETGDVYSKINLSISIWTRYNGP